MSQTQTSRTYSLKEVAKKLKLTTGMIRQWEKDFAGLLIIPRSKQGSRYFTENEITLLKKIKELREQNMSKAMIHSMLEQQMQLQSDEAIEEIEEQSSYVSYEPLDMEVPQQEITLITNEWQTIHPEQFQLTIEQFKQELLDDIKSEILHSRQTIVDEIKSEIQHSSLHTVKELSKSIQRSNDKRKADVTEISSLIKYAAKQNAETLSAVSEGLLQDAQSNYQQMIKKLQETAKTTEKSNKMILQKVTQTVKDSQEELKHVAQNFDTQQDYLIESINDLKQSKEEIEKREAIFQSMLATYREVAAAKNRKKKWWHRILAEKKK